MSGLLDYLADGPERCGFILKDGSIVEVENIAANPSDAFRMSAKSIEAYIAQATATWHTHPGASRNLSVADYRTFITLPHLDHYIVGVDGVRRYFVQDGDLLSA